MLGFQAMENKNLELVSCKENRIRIVFTTCLILPLSKNSRSKKKEEKICQRNYLWVVCHMK